MKRSNWLQCRTDARDSSDWLFSVNTLLCSRRCIADMERQLFVDDALRALNEMLIIGKR